ncbi:type II toxin-antitoxin system PemK/MazF family toxin [Arthrobacter sp. PGP41]|uniref:type II toxin-antitoxin system PemK/MazF family toxin n=1 Tax=Arthrobacter sp. PGP41 TaxID=2079227 RepID=UPI000CDC3E69|nr:type II toxin-antitoxin system PemK/MazF family toxin [Arthrobacter sp. PGP41]AUZ34841.1 type II toxin-antitoxin system PemK/MazF family toxin [Arthrobacter sp. PGP41]
MVLNLRSLQDAVRTGLRALRDAARTSAAPGPGSSRGRAAPAAGDVYPGDFQGRFSVRYAPRPDGEPDPGEVVWAWVPYEEDHSRGKDRPVLLVGRSGSYLLGVMLTSRDRVPEAATSQDYVDLGAGAWDRQGRASEARLDRIVQLRPDGIRREGAVLDRARFDTVAAGLRRRHGWT